LWYPPYLPFSGSNSLGVKRAVHDAVGGFDKSLQRSMDTDYCVRIQLRGVPLVFLEEAVVRYRYRGGAGMTFQQGRLWAQHHVLSVQAPPGNQQSPATAETLPGRLAASRPPLSQGPSRGGPRRGDRQAGLAARFTLGQHEPPHDAPTMTGSARLPRFTPSPRPVRPSGCVRRARLVRSPRCP